MAEQIRIVIVDDHNMVRSGLAMLLGVCDDMELVGQAKNGLEAISICAELEPDVVLMDLMMPELSGVDAIAAISKEQPGIRIIALTSFKEDDLVYQALQAGAISYLLKDVTIDELSQAIRDADEGKATITSHAMQALLKMKTQSSTPQYKLTERELDVLALIVLGQTNRQIAEELTLSVSTVKFHVSSILSKLDVSSRTEAAALAVQNDLVN